MLSPSTPQASPWLHVQSEEYNLTSKDKGWSAKENWIEAFVSSFLSQSTTNYRVTTSSLFDRNARYAVIVLSGSFQRASGGGLSQTDSACNSTSLSKRGCLMALGRPQTQFNVTI